MLIIDFYIMYYCTSKNIVNLQQQPISHFAQSFCESVCMHCDYNSSLYSVLYTAQPLSTYLIGCSIRN